VCLCVSEEKQRRKKQVNKKDIHVQRLSEVDAIIEML
jgi:hypothetical protein